MKRQRQWYQRISLRYQVLAGVAVGLLVLFALMGYLSLNTTRRASDIVFTERLRQAQTAASSIDALLHRTVHQLETVAGMGALADRETLRERGSPVLDNLIHIMSTYDRLWLVDKGGTVLWASSGGQESLLADVVRGPFFSRALNEGVTVVDQVDVTEFPHPPIAVVVAPVRDKQGQVYAGLVGGLHLSHMSMNLASLPQGGESFISTVVDRRGIVMATSEGIDFAFPYPDPHLTLLRDFIEQHRPGVAIHEEPGGGHMVVYAPLSAMQGGVIMEERRDIALAIVTDLRNTYIFLGVAALLLASLGAWVHVQTVTRPLEALGTAARRIAAGELDRPIATARGDEIGQLAHSFETMRQELKASQEERERWGTELEGRVRQRTEEVHQLLGRIISAQEEERKRLARELHDETAQTLATLLLGITSLQRALPTGDSRQGEMLDRFLAQGEQALRDIRRIILDLRPSNLDDMGLVAALRSFAEDRLRAAGIQVQFATRGEERRLPGAVETALFRIMQEAVTNVVKHSRATSAHILVEFGPRMFMGLVEDNGVGFEAETKQGPDGTGLGLQGMKERADLVGARLEVASTPGRGSRVRVEMPLPEAGLG